MGHEKTSNLPQIIEDYRQSAARNFETAQHIDKQITDVSSTINVLQNGTKLGAITLQGFHAAQGESWPILHDAQKLAYFVQ